MLLHSETKVLGSKQWYAAKRFYEACKIPICPASSLESSWHCPCVRASLVPFQSSIILDRSVWTNEMTPIFMLDQWELRKILLTIVWGEPWQQWRGLAPSQTQTHFPHDQVILSSLNCPRCFDQWAALTASHWPIRGQDIWHLIPDWGGNDVWDVHCRMGRGCMQQGCCRLCRSAALMWNMFVSFLADERTIAHGENGVGNPRSSGNYKLDAAVKMILWSQYFCQ